MTIRPATDEVRRSARVVRSVPGTRRLLLPVGSGPEISRYEPG
ncbi:MULTISPECIES: hypothetical protein [unclassified Aureimonas]|nr:MULTISPECIES: hypothetical protein [unclassified Aureimonas]